MKRGLIMVQVDVFWTYAIGAGFAVAASKPIENESPDEKGAWYKSAYFTANILFLSILFAPSGVCLLWAFPSWETMHVGDRNLPAWLVTLFASTNITQGVLGYWVAHRLIRAGYRYAALLQMALGYFLLFFILVHGWDGTGCQRFFSATKTEFVNWNITNAFRWLISDVALTLYLFGVIMIPLMLYMMSSWFLTARDQSKINSKDDEHREKWDITKLILFIILGGTLVMAIAASILVRLFDWWIGLAVFGILAYVAALRKGGYVHKWAVKLLGEPGK